MCLPCFPWTWVQHEDPLDSMPEQSTWVFDGNQWVLMKLVCTLALIRIIFVCFHLFCLHRMVAYPCFCALLLSSKTGEMQVNFPTSGNGKNCLYSSAIAQDEGKGERPRSERPLQNSPPSSRVLLYHAATTPPLVFSYFHLLLPPTTNISLSLPFHDAHRTFPWLYF